MNDAGICIHGPDKRIVRALEQLQKSSHHPGTQSEGISSSVGKVIAFIHRSYHVNQMLRDQTMFDIISSATDSE